MFFHSFIQYTCYVGLSAGTARIPSYLARVRAGVLDPISEMVFDQKTPVVYFVDAKNGIFFLSLLIFTKERT